jgi:hypothetical protein
MKQQAQKKITDIKQSPFTGMGISKEASIWNMRPHLTTIAAVLFATALHPSIMKAQGTAAPTDPQIVGIVETADDIDINYAKLALSKARDKQVRDFAQQMITDHSAVQKSVINVASKLNVTPADSPDQRLRLRRRPSRRSKSCEASRARHSRNPTLTTK